MSAIGKLVEKLRHRRAARRALTTYQGQGGGDRPLRVTPATKTSPPVIHGPFGDTTESARHQAALNIKADADVRARVVALATAQFGSEERAMAYLKQAYPEAGWPDA